MKKVFLVTTTILLSSLFLLSCKKDKPQSVTQKLQHSWTIENIIDNYHDASGDYKDTTAASSSDFINFNANGTFTSHSDGSDHNGIYSVLSDTEISVDGETYTIKSLTDKILVLYIKIDYTATEYEELTINTKR